MGKAVNDIYVGIDPGVANCALVAFSPTRGLMSTWKPRGKFPTGVMRLRKLMVGMNEELERLQREGRILQVAMEGYSMAEKYGQHNSGEVGATIKLLLLAVFGDTDRRAFPLIVAPQQLKKFVTGKGNTKKEMMPKEVFKRWGEDFNDVNLAEAYGLARMAYAYESNPEMTAFQREVMTALEGHTEWVPAVDIPSVRKRLVRPPR